MSQSQNDTKSVKGLNLSNLCDITRVEGQLGEVFPLQLPVRMATPTRKGFVNLNTSFRSKHSMRSRLDSMNETKEPVQISQYRDMISRNNCTNVLDAIATGNVLET